MKKYYVIFLLFLSVNIFIESNNVKKGESKFYLPFMTVKDRKDINEIKNRISDGFGAYRIYGHKHAGLDINGSFDENIYSIGNGQVVNIWYTFPNLAVVIEYKFYEGKTFYVSYVHLGEIFVKKGERVDHNTKIGRLFNRTEFTSSGFKNNHLHLEVRKSINDNGKASYSCKTIEELNKYFYDPLIFFQNELVD
ncbi:MAG: M23 family metallopeptidase [Spirochaetes bacterium]|nr:M23 family metallopeptidase [Spirochaetota bacterium]